MKFSKLIQLTNMIYIRIYDEAMLDFPVASNVIVSRVPGLKYRRTAA